jgi:hypothetical protein
MTDGSVEVALGSLHHLERNAFHFGDFPIRDALRHKLKPGATPHVSYLHLLRGWEKLLHQAFLVGLEGFVLSGFGGDQGVEAAQARGDALLLGRLRNEERVFNKLTTIYRIDRSAKISCDMFLVSVGLEKLKNEARRFGTENCHECAMRA